MAENIDRPASAADALAIIEQARTRAAGVLGPNPAALTAVWGAGYLVAGTLYYLHLVGLVSGLVTVLACAAALAAAITISTVISVRAAQGVHTPFERQAAMYGAGWTVAMLLTYGLGAGIGNPTFWPTLYVFVVGALFMMGGVVWPSGVFYGSGIWIMATAVVAAFVPSPTHVLVLTIGAAGGMLALAAVLARRGATAR